MKDIIEIINTTIKNLNNKNVLITPTNFEREFYSILKTTDLILEESIEFDDIVDNLSKEEKKSFTNNSYDTFRDLTTLLNNRIPDIEIKHFLKDFSYFMSPSIDKDIKEEIDEICTSIASNPKELLNTETIRELRKLTNKRITNDKLLFNEKTDDVKKLIFFLGDHFKKTLNNSRITMDEVVEIKDELTSLKLSNSSKNELELLQEKIMRIMERFENSLINNEKDALSGQTQSDYLYEQIEELQASLNKAEEEKSIDYLTGVLTRRAYMLKLDQLERNYKIFDSNYAIIFYDIDNFKMINDTYGHLCGDFILKTFASILKKLTRTEDIISRYGGEEFLSIVFSNNTLDIESYLRRVKNIITNNRFVYGDIKIHVEFCAGVTFRNNYNSYEDAFKFSDKLLYQAKEEGRNKIILDTGVIF